MPIYFAYGSNMVRRRLVARVGAVDHLAIATLRGYRHRFNKRGRDGTAKGNVEVDPTGRVWGVLYELLPAQFAKLASYERGYRPLEVSASLDVKDELPSAGEVYTFSAVAPVDGLLPTRQYLAWYEEAVREHRFPAEYGEELFGGLLAV